MTIDIYPLNNLLVLTYSPDNGTDWVREKLRENGDFPLKNTFHFKIEHLLEDAERVKIERAFDEDTDLPDDDSIFDRDSISFILGELSEEYYWIAPGKVTHHYNLFLHKDIKFDIKLFTSTRFISVFAKMERFINRDIIIGGEAENAIPEEAMWDLIKKFPNTVQKNLYEGAIITDLIRDYVDNIPDYRARYENYLNKRKTVAPSDLTALVRDLEIHKFQLILDKLEDMLRTQETIHERQWQEEILTIITLIYPKYIDVFRSIPVKRQGQTSLQLDMLLVDSGGYVDIVEIKKPAASKIVTPGKYRDNHIPYRELSGTIMQIEKYIYYLNRWGVDGEKYLSGRLKGLPAGFEIKLTNPGGLIIMGRDNDLTPEQLKDFEVIKRKYKNIMDILTYDELIRRLKFTIELWRANPNPE